MDIRWMVMVAGVTGLGVFGSAACSDESMTGPMFGDLTFTPSFENIGNGRTVELILSNAGSVELGPILVGSDFPKNVDFPDSICTTIDVDATPSNVASLAPGADVVIDIDLDTSGTTPDNCPPAQYDLDVFAAVDNQVLGGATVRFSLEGSTP
jgi:hypothetical protein